MVFLSRKSVADRQYLLSLVTNIKVHYFFYISQTIIVAETKWTDLSVSPPEEAGL